MIANAVMHVTVALKMLQENVLATPVNVAKAVPETKTININAI